MPTDRQVAMVQFHVSCSIWPVPFIYPAWNGFSPDCVAILGPLSATAKSLILHLVAVALFALGLVLTLRRETPPAHGPEKLIRFGPMFFAVPLAVFGMQHFALFDVVKFAVPAWMPAHPFWVYLVGTALIAACLSILTGIRSDLAALLIGIMLCLFVLMIYVPNLVRNPHDRFAITVPLRDLALSGGALSLAGTLGAVGRGHPARWLIELGRWFFAVPMLYFGVEHFLHPQFAPGMPFPKTMPTWIPAPTLWSYLTGAVLAICGLGILANQRARAAATWLGIALLFLTVVVYLPLEIAHPSIAISGELDYVADTLAMSGAALLVAGAASAKRAAR
jgi:uncharacterized membrane protein